MSIKISRSVYANMFGPTTGDRVRLADTDIIIEVEKDFTVYGEEVKFGGGKVIRDGMGQSQLTNQAGRGRHRDHQRADSRSLGHREGRCRPEGRQGPRDRQSRQSGRAAGRHHHHRTRHRDHRRRRQDPHSRRLRHSYSFHLPAAGRRRADVGRDFASGRRYRTRARHACHHMHARALAYRPHDPGRGCVSGQSWLYRQGQCISARIIWRRW
jgi:hypothetical protein